VAPHAHGNYTLDPVRLGDKVVFIATGTGEAPHNAMLADLLAKGHRGRVASVVCVRQRRDLGYLREHRLLMEQFPKYRYLTLTTREPENLDSSLANYVGKRYLQDYLASGDLEHDLGWKLSAADTHVFLCGSPQMIGAPHAVHDSKDHLPRSLGMVEVLSKRGFHVDQSLQPGNIHYEKFW
jgi:ferredoxin--NADP+ reductase